MTVIGQLFTLQQIDTRLKDIEAAQLDQTELKRLVQMKKEEQKIQVRGGQLEWRLKSIQRQVSQGEAQALDIAQRIEKYQEKLYGGSIQNSKELGKLEAQIELLSTQRLDLEQEILEMMEEVEQIERELIVIQGDCEDLRNGCRELEKTLKDRLAQLSIEEKRLRSKREQLVKMIPDNFYQNYLHLYSRHNGLAVVRVKKGVCTGCQVSLSPLVLDKAKRLAEPVCCEFCGRILFAKVKKSAKS